MVKRVLVLSLLLSGCDYYDHRLEIVNNSKSEIAVETYSDTVPDFPSINKTEFYMSRRIMLHDSVELMKMSKNGWSKAIAISKNKKLNLIVYSIDSLRKYQNIDTLIRRKIYMRYEFSKDDLNRANWKVILR